MKIRVSRRFLALLGVFIVGIGVGVGGMFAKQMFFPDTEPTEKVAKKADEVGPIIELKEFLVNLDGGGIIKTEIAIEGINAKSGEKIKAKELFIRDRIIAVLGSKSLPDVRSIEGRDNLKEDLVTNLNEICEEEIQDVLFKSFLYN